jgi:hypothetical protein
MNIIKSFDEFILEFRSDGMRDPRAELKKILRKHGGAVKLVSGNDRNEFLLNNITDANIIDHVGKGGFLGFGKKTYEEIKDKYEKKYAKPGWEIFLIYLEDNTFLVIKFPEKEYDRWLERK